MKKTIILLFTAAATVLISLCGVFLYETLAKDALPVKAELQELPQGSAFSFEKAQEYIDLCSQAYDEALLKEGLRSLGFSEYKYVERNQSSSFGSGIAFGIAAMREADSTTVLAVFRGTHKGEWYSNFHIGEGREHAGFSAATDFALDETAKYLKRLQTDNDKINVIITGHSRGGAVANLLAKRLLTSGEYKSVTAYTFACPNTTTAEDAKSSAYKSIYNIVNPEDFICYIPLEKWGYTKYGTTVEFPRNTQEGYEEKYSKMQESFESITGYPHTGYPMGASDIKIFLNTAAQLAPTVSDYYNKELTVTPHRLTLYDYMQKVAALLCGDNPLQNGMFLVSSGSSKLFDTLTGFMMEGISIEDVAKEADITASAINCGHTYETYKAWMSVLGEEYFDVFTPVG